MTPSASEIIHRPRASWVAVLNRRILRAIRAKPSSSLLPGRSPALPEYEDKPACPGNRRYRDCRCNSLDLSGSTTSLTFWANSSPARYVQPHAPWDQDQQNAECNVICNGHRILQR